MDVVLPVIAGTSVAVTGAAILYRKYRLRYPVEVNCWFCNEDTKVPFGNQNCWDCPNCEQYNGFTQDGDYNKPIPAQFMEDLNHPVTSENKTPPAKRWMPSEPAPLCELCSHNQVLKVHQLADFVPENEATYEIEVEQYKAYLERVYGLCLSCERNITDVICKQNQVLEKKLSRLRKDTSFDEVDDGPAIQEANVSASDSILSESTVIHMSTPRSLHLLRYMVCVCINLVTLSSVYNLLAHSQAVKPSEIFPRWLLSVIKLMVPLTHRIVITGLLGNLCAIYISGRDRLSIADAVHTILWVFLLALFGLSSSESLDYKDIYILQFALSVLCLVASLWCTFVPRHRISCGRRLTKRRCRSPNTTGVSSTTSSMYDYSPAPSVSSRRNMHQNQSTSAENDLYNEKSPRRNVKKDEDYLSRLETFSVGSASRRPASHIRAFGNFGDTRMFVSSSTNHPSTPPRHLSGHLGSRPLISPARFKHKPSFLGNSAFTNAAFQPNIFGSRHRNSSMPAAGFTTLADLSTNHMPASSFDLPNSWAPTPGDDHASLFSEPRSPSQAQETDDSSTGDTLSNASHEGRLRKRPRAQADVQKQEPSMAVPQNSAGAQQGRKPGRTLRVLQTLWICITVLVLFACLGGFEVLTELILSTFANDTDKVVIIDPVFVNYSTKK